MYRARSTFLASSHAELIPRRLNYRAVADDATESVYVYRPYGMTQGLNILLYHCRLIYSPYINSPEYTLHVVGDEYFISVMGSCDVDIASLNGALLQHAARCQIQRVAFTTCLDWPRF